MISPLTAGMTLFVAVLVFGPKNLPLLARNSGLALNEFKQALNGQLPKEEAVAEATTKP
jgi:TatA/E family protein of Tat protein translocase